MKKNIAAFVFGLILLVSLILTLSFEKRMQAATDLSKAKTIWDIEINSGDIVAYGKYKDHPLTWRVLTVTDHELVMITEEIIDTIPLNGTTGTDALATMDRYMSDFNSTYFRLDAHEAIAILEPARIMTKNEVFGGADTSLTNPNTSSYFKNNNERMAVTSSWAHQAEKCNWWATHTKWESSTNRVMNVNAGGTIAPYTDWKSMGMRPSIKVKRKHTILETHFQDALGNAVVRENEQEALTGSVLGDLSTNGQGTITYTASGDLAELELVEDAADSSKAQIRAKQDLTEGAYTLQVTTKDDDGEIATVTIHVTVLKAYPTSDELEFTPSDAISPDAAPGEVLGTASLNGLSNAAQIKAAYQVEEALFSIENASNLNLTMDAATGQLSFRNTLDSGAHTFDLVITLKENGVATRTIRKPNCSIMVDMDLIPEFTGVTTPLVYKGVFGGNSYTEKDMQIGTLSVNGVNESDVTSYQIAAGANGSSFRIDQKNKLFNTESIHAKAYTVNLSVIAKGIMKQGSVTLSVEKAKPSVKFQERTITKKSITQAQTGWMEEVEPIGPGLKVRYSVSGGNVGVIDIDADTGEITYKGNGAFGKVMIKATVDDDPASGYDDYQAVTVEKEINIYQEVDGILTPDSASQSTMLPTFAAHDPNVKAGGVIGTVSGTLGTPDVITGSVTTYTYKMKDGGNASFFEIDEHTGVIKTKADLSVDTYTFTIVVVDQWSTKDLPITVSVGMAEAEELKFHESSSSKKAITSLSVSLNDTGVKVHARVLNSSNTKAVKYTIKDHSTNVITVDQHTGAITIKGVGTVTIVAEKEGAAGQADASAELVFTVTAGKQNLIYTDQAGNELPKTNDKYNAYVEAYGPGKAFQLYTAGNPSGTSVSYSLKSTSPTDVLTVDADGTIHILNASLTSQMGKVIIIATSHDPTGNYTDESIELPINIEKGTRTVAFADDPIYVSSGTGSITPVINVDGVIDSDGTALIEIDAGQDSSIAWTNDNQTIQYEYHEAIAKDISITVTKPADRNYKVATGSGTLHMMGADENVLAITSPGKIIYGDHFKIRSTQDDSSSSNVQYTFAISDSTYISEPVVNGNQAEFDALKFSGQTATAITVTRTADGEVPLSKTVTANVLPKPIEIQIDDQTKLRGEENPELTYQSFASQLVSWNGVQDSIQSTDVKIVTAATATSNAGSYPLKGDSSYLNKTYPNYQFTFIEGALTITEDVIENDWYHMELEDGKQTPYKGEWTNQDVRIVSDHSEYVNISKDQTTWHPTALTINQEGKQEHSFWMKKASGAISGEKKETIQIDQTAPTIKNITAKDSNNALQDLINTLSGGIFFKPGTTFEIVTSDENGPLDTSGSVAIQYELYQKANGDYGTAMQSDSITVNDETAAISIDQTTGAYKICMIVSDHAGNASEKACYELDIKKLNTDVDGDGKPDFNDPDEDGCADFNILYKDEDTGEWNSLNVDANRDGIPEMNIDSDGDGKPDINVDTDGDGKPDLNLIMMSKELWKPTQCVTQHGEQYESVMTLTPQINVDLYGEAPNTPPDGVPDINIDNKGDFKPHLNVVTQTRYGEITTNLIDLYVWTPDQDYTVSRFTYDTITAKAVRDIDTDGDGLPDLNIDLNDNGIADLNIDTDGDGIPNVQIDSDGDGKPDINIDHSGKGIPEENIVEIKKWEPKKDITEDKIYDTMEIPMLDHVEDGGVQVKPKDPDKQLLPSYALKVHDVTKNKKEEMIKEVLKGSTEKDVVKVYDMELLKDNAAIQPDGTMTVRIPIVNGLKNPSIMLEYKQGVYQPIQPRIEDGYYVFETSYIGNVLVLDDVQSAANPEPPKTVEPGDDVGGTSHLPNSSVKGTYTNVSGAATGDGTALHSILLYTLLSALLIVAMYTKQRHT